MPGTNLDQVSCCRHDHKWIKISIGNDDEMRQDLVKRLRKETLQRHTYDIRVVEFIRSLQKHFSFSVQKVDGINGDDVTSGTCNNNINNSTEKQDQININNSINNNQ